MNIFIVEDEYWALAEMKILLERYESDHNIYYFENGEEAYQSLKQVTPDLIISDITMPVMDGLELIEKAKLIDPTIQCVLLTVHDTFDYAKKGIQLDVADYILKPIKKEELFKTIDQMIEHIKKQKKEEKDREHWSINQLLFRSIQQNNYDLQHFDEQSFLFINILFGNWKAPFIKNENIDIDEIRSTVNEGEIACWLLSITGRQKILLFSVNKERSISDFSIEQLQNYLLQFGQAHTCVLWKDSKTTLSEIFKMSNIQIEKGKFFGRPTKLTGSVPLIEENIQNLWDRVRVIEKTFHDQKFALLDQQVKELVAQIKQENIRQRQLYLFLTDMYYAMIYNLQQLTSIVIKIDHIDDYFDKLHTFITFEELEQWLIDLMDKLVMAMPNHNIAPKHLIPKVKQWMEESYQQNITFQQFADEHHVSLSYLSREFKKQTDITFSEHLTNVRINKAKELFKSGIERTVEVAELVGYSDVKYFRSVFKRITGITPTAYKEVQKVDDFNY